MMCTERCPECPSRSLVIGQKPVVSGDWNRGPFNIVFVGEGPGKEENNRRRVFVGATGEEFNNTYLPCAGLSRSEISMTNTVKCWWANSSDPPPDYLVKSCSEFHLRRELEFHKPEVVVLMGGVANSMLDLDVEMEHGMFAKRRLLGWEGMVFSTFHPALGLHKSDKMLQMLEREDGDFPRLRRYLRGELRATVDKYPEPELVRLKNPKHIRSLLQKRYLDPIAVDTESKKIWRGYKSTIRYRPYCATACIDPGFAFMVKVEDRDAWTEFGNHLQRFYQIVMHNAMHDHTVLAMEQIELEWHKIQDTMSMAYDDGRLPKGLKALSYRLLGHRMTSFDEVVVPPSRERALEYLEMAMGMDWPKPVQEPTGAVSVKKCPECKGSTVLSLGRGQHKKFYPCDCGDGYVTIPKMTRKQSMNDKLWRLATDLRKNPNVDLWERWEGWETDVEPLIQSIGPMPLPSIEHADEDRQITYACGDAHDTRRIWPILTERLAKLRRSIQV